MLNGNNYVNNAVSSNMWNRVSTTALIDFYRTHECLWNTVNPHYRNRSMRLSALQDIANSLCEFRTKTSVDDVKNKINGIRTQYVAEKNKMALFMKKIPKIAYEPSLWCYEKLSFLAPFISPKKINSAEQNAASSETRVDMPIPTIIKEEPDMDCISVTSTNDEDYLPPIKKSKDIFDTYLPGKPDVSIGSKMEESNEKNSDAEGEMMSVQRPKNENKSEDWIDIFGKFVASQMRRITDQVLLIKLQHKIQNAIMESQLHQIEMDK